ncbi:hypothetical protein [Rickettsia felis]|nr:hypothetical protein [Rickettsia felis]
MGVGIPRHCEERSDAAISCQTPEIASSNYYVIFLAMTLQSHFIN